MSQTGIMVTGATGLLGSAVLEYLKSCGRVTQAVTRRACDLSKPRDIVSALEKLEPPEAIVHCAAWTDVDRAEDQPQECRRINVDASAALARYAQKQGAAFLFVSSGGVFDGTQRRPYTEEDTPAPRTVYHQSKLDGEWAVMESHPDAIVARVGWLFGGAADQPRNFVARRIEEARGKTTLQSSAEQWGTPCFGRDVAHQFIQLLDRKSKGVFHVANGGMCSRMDYVSEILRRSGSSTTVANAPSGSFKRKANVPPNESITSVRFEAERISPLRHWRDALAQYIQNEVL